MAPNLSAPWLECLPSSHTWDTWFFILVSFFQYSRLLVPISTLLAGGSTLVAGLLLMLGAGFGFMLKLPLAIACGFLAVCLNFYISRRNKRVVMQNIIGEGYLGVVNQLGRFPSLIDGLRNAGVCTCFSCNLQYLTYLISWQEALAILALILWAVVAFTPDIITKWPFLDALSWFRMQLAYAWRLKGSVFAQMFVSALGIVWGARVFIDRWERRRDLLAQAQLRRAREAYGQPPDLSYYQTPREGDTAVEVEARMRRLSIAVYNSLSPPSVWERVGVPKPTWTEFYTCSGFLLTLLAAAADALLPERSACRSALDRGKAIWVTWRAGLWPPTLASYGWALLVVLGIWLVAYALNARNVRRWRKSYEEAYWALKTDFRRRGDALITEAASIAIDMQGGYPSMFRSFIGPLIFNSFQVLVGVLVGWLLLTWSHVGYLPARALPQPHEHLAPGVGATPDAPGAHAGVGGWALRWGDMSFLDAARVNLLAVRVWKRGGLSAVEAAMQEVRTLRYAGDEALAAQARARLAHLQSKGLDELPRLSSKAEQRWRLGVVRDGDLVAWEEDEEVIERGCRGQGRKYIPGSPLERGECAPVWQPKSVVAEGVHGEKGKGRAQKKPRREQADGLSGGARSADEAVFDERCASGSGMLSEALRSSASCAGSGVANGIDGKKDQSVRASKVTGAQAGAKPGPGKARPNHARGMERPAASTKKAIPSSSSTVYHLVCMLVATMGVLALSRFVYSRGYHKSPAKLLDDVALQVQRWVGTTRATGGRHGGSSGGAGRSKKSAASPSSSSSAAAKPVAAAAGSSKAASKPSPAAGTAASASSPKTPGSLPATTSASSASSLASAAGAGTKSRTAARSSTPSTGGGPASEPAATSSSAQATASASPPVQRTPSASSQGAKDRSAPESSTVQQKQGGKAGAGGKPGKAVKQPSKQPTRAAAAAGNAVVAAADPSEPGEWQTAGSRRGGSAATTAAADSSSTLADSMPFTAALASAAAPTGGSTGPPSVPTPAAPHPATTVPSAWEAAPPPPAAAPSAPPPKPAAAVPAPTPGAAAAQPSHARPRIPIPIPVPVPSTPVPPSAAAAPAAASPPAATTPSAGPPAAPSWTSSLLGLNPALAHHLRRTAAAPPPAAPPAAAHAVPAAAAAPSSAAPQPPATPAAAAAAAAPPQRACLVCGVGSRCVGLLHEAKVCICVCRACAGGIQPGAACPDPACGAPVKRKLDVYGAGL